MREISPELEGAEVGVALTCKHQVWHAVDSFFITKSSGLAQQRQHLCGTAGAQRSELSGEGQGDSARLSGRCYRLVLLAKVIGFAPFVCAPDGYLTTENTPASLHLGNLFWMRMLIAPHEHHGVLVTICNSVTAAPWLKVGLLQ